MSILDRDFSKIVPSAFMTGSLAQAVNVLEAALEEIKLLKKEKEDLERNVCNLIGLRDFAPRDDDGW
jgi:hypothetical protein